MQFYFNIQFFYQNIRDNIKITIKKKFLLPTTLHRRAEIQINQIYNVKIFILSTCKIDLYIYIYITRPWCGKSKVDNMWRLKVGAESVGEKDEKWVKSVSNHLGRQVWEFCAADAAAVTPHQLLQIQNARNHFHRNRFHRKQSSDLFLAIQVHNRMILSTYILITMKE